MADLFVCFEFDGMAHIYSQQCHGQKSFCVSVLRNRHTKQRATYWFGETDAKQNSNAFDA